MKSNPSKSSGRTPPFVFVGLVLLVVILGYNYWMMSSSNKNLKQMNEQLTINTKSSEDKRLGAEKSLESAREEMRVVEGNLEQVKKSLSDREGELNTLRAKGKEWSAKVDESKAALVQCNTNVQTEKKNVENLNAEKVNLEKDLKAKSGQPGECTLEACMKPVKDMLIISTKLVGTDKMSKALTDSKLDANKLMEGIERVEVPEQKEPAPQN